MKNLLALVLVLSLCSTVASAQDVASPEPSEPTTTPTTASTDEPSGTDGTVTATTTTTTTAPTTTTTATATATPIAVAPTTVSATASTTRATVQEEESCEQQSAPVFDPASPRFEVAAGGGYSLLFVTFRQLPDFAAEGEAPDGLYFGPLFRGEVSFALGSLSISAVYTHIFSQHDGSDNRSLDWQILSAEIGLQCACHDSTYVWSFGVEGGFDINNETMLIGLEHRSIFYIWEGLYAGFDFDIAILVGLPFRGPSGGGITGSLFVGYAFG